jgi:hypothetical protein
MTDLYLRRKTLPELVEDYRGGQTRDRCSWHASRARRYWKDREERLMREPSPDACLSVEEARRLTARLYPGYATKKASSRREPEEETCSDDMNDESDDDGPEKLPIRSDDGFCILVENSRRLAAELASILPSSSTLSGKDGSAPYEEEAVGKGFEELRPFSAKSQTLTATTAATFDAFDSGDDGLL